MSPSEQAKYLLIDTSYQCTPPGVYSLFLAYFQISFGGMIYLQTQKLPYMFKHIQSVRICLNISKVPVCISSNISKVSVYGCKTSASLVLATALRGRHRRWQSHTGLRAPTPQLVLHTHTTQLPCTLTVHTTLIHVRHYKFGTKMVLHTTHEWYWKGSQKRRSSSRLLGKCSLAEVGAL